MKISLSMIVKDEIRFLARCLDSIENFVDEIVIVDTGSTDGTYDVVKKRATRYAQIEWSGFANARNASAELCTGDWIVIIDADEEMVDSSGWPAMIAAMEEGKYDAFAIVIQNQLPGNQILASDRIWQIRCFPNRPEIKWTGSVHNQISEALIDAPLNGEKAEFQQAQIAFKHDGYNLPKDELTKKYERRMAFLKKELETADTPKLKAYYEFQTANALFMQNLHEEAYEHIKACDLDAMTLENCYSVCLMAVHCAHTLGHNKEGMVFAKRMMEDIPGEAMSFLLMGLSLLVEGNPQGAYNFLGSALTMSQIQDMQYKYLLDTHYIAAAAGEAALALQRFGDAKELFRMHLAKYQTPRILDLESKIVRVGSPLILDSQGSPQKTQATNGQANPAEGLIIPDARTIGLLTQSE